MSKPRLLRPEGFAHSVALAPFAAKVAWPTPAPPPLPVSTNSTSLPVPTRSTPRPTTTPPATVSVPEPPVDTAAAQLNVPGPVALADTGALTTGVPLSVPVQLPVPAKLYVRVCGVAVRPFGEKVALPETVQAPETTLAALAEATGASANAASASGSMRSILLILRLVKSVQAGAARYSVAAYMPLNSASGSRKV